MEKERILNVLPGTIRMILRREHLKYEYLQEIKLRIGQPLILVYKGEELVPGGIRDKPHIVTAEEVRETLDYVSGYSLYAFEQEMRQGFITIEGGHRVGVTGQAILEEGKVRNIKYISSINIRMAHEVPGCADKVFPYITYNRQLAHTMIISPPGCGKTTLLRDIVRQVSDGNEWVRGMTVGVVDERSEIGGSYMGIAQNHLGVRTDVLDGCPKAEGMIMLIRSMGPQVIAVDEIGMESDVHAIEYAMHCGCKMLVTAHGSSIEEIAKKPELARMIEAQAFERYIVLENKEQVGQVSAIYDGSGKQIA
ncbi:stage III sporulation protein AA [Sporofaciens sp. SGI.106]|uniref:stage III sporulation protein AA n=1 Tax=Sporofaciens sp. SGI.106 TaxID=3420568 RepID=UPI003CFF3C9F